MAELYLDVSVIVALPSEIVLKVRLESVCPVTRITFWFDTL